ncbi:carboxypeptidase-like regulatory domain-containing protein [Winogradskyella vidalii]|uniref:carboxypeptidase-like regulatory domain-containing protein n=1 Tax=Winogradskyella vidalii TaxID=2615024 RepID=UPI0015C96423|nr:carboxypeptidase-like regulatory domain-containing protein [Winogradskyella vidalii]
MNKIILLLFSAFSLLSFGQNLDRTSVSGKIVVSSEDKEGVAVFNSSSNKGTITDENGDFTINVSVNDIVEFSALQFEDFSVTITDKIIKSKQLTVILVEEINKLDEVVLLPFGLTGNINADLSNVRTYNVDLDAIYFGLDNIEDFEFSADYKTEADNLAFNEYNPRVDNMLDLVNVAGFLIKQVVNTSTIKFKSEREKQLELTPFRKALDTYSVNFIHTNFDIPLNQVEAFADYLEKEDLDEALFEDGNEMQLLERINQLSKSFLKNLSEND